MPIVLVLLLAASCAPLPWWEPPFGLGASASLAMTCFAMLIPLSASMILSRWAEASIRAAPYRRPEVAARYARLRRFIGYLLLLAAVGSIVFLGWGWSVWHRAIITFQGREILTPFAELLVPAPYLLSIFAAWLIHYDAEKAIHDASIDGVKSFWSRRGHFEFNFRPFVLLVLTPVLLMTLHSSFIRVAPHLAEHWITVTAQVLMFPLFFIFMPLLVKPMLGLVPLPSGPTRDRLEALARRLDFRCTDILLWHTRSAMANAMVVGVVPWIRYVILTDKLLETLDSDEVDAVFGHEVGHVKHGHIPYYALFLMLSVIVTVCGVALMLQLIDDYQWIDLEPMKEWLKLSPLLVLGVYLFLVFGYLSRKCERQADLFGCRVGGIAAMVRALERVALLNGIESNHPLDMTRWKRFLALLKAWQHGSISERVSYLLWVEEDPAREKEFQRKLFLFRSALMLGLIGIVALLGAWIGWNEIIRAL